MTSTMKETPKNALYVYGFTLNEPVDLNILGIDDSHPVYHFTHSGFNAIISDVLLADFTGEKGDANLQNVAWLTPKICRHALIIDMVMKQGTVYPLPFGTLFSNLSALKQKMHHSASAIQETLHHVSNCEEWAIEATLDHKKNIDALLADSLKSGRFDLPKAAGRRHLEEQKIRKILATELIMWLDSTIITLQKKLKPVIHDVRPRQLGNDKVINFAYLVKIDEKLAFEQRIKSFEHDYENYGLTFRMTGPWPPYTFSQLSQI